MEPSPHLVLLTTSKINKFLMDQNQTESYISELWVFNTLKNYLGESFQVGLVLSDCEISDRVTTIAARRITANIVTAERYKSTWETHPHSRLSSAEANSSFDGAYRLRSEVTDTTRKDQAGFLKLPDRSVQFNG